MADTSAVDDRTAAVELGKMLQEHRAGEVVVMDLRELNAWTDYFIIATVTSSAHLQGLQRHIKEFAQEKGIEILRRHKKPAPDDEWNLTDLGSIVIHLMTNRSRSFYELERLWGEASILYQGDSDRETHSSKSS